MKIRKQCRQRQESVLFYVIRELNWKPAIDVEIDKVILLLQLTLSTNQIQVYDTIVVNLMEIIDDLAIKVACL